MTRSTPGAARCRPRRIIGRRPSRSGRRRAEPEGRNTTVIASEAKQSRQSRICGSRLLRFARNDDNYGVLGRRKRPGAQPLQGDVTMRPMLYVITALLACAGAAQAQEIDWKKVDDALGRPGAVSGDVHRYGFPRSDLQVTLEGVAIKPAFALGGWVAVKPMHGSGAMVMGDLVLLQTEVNPVMAKLIDGGLDVTAVHNHLLRAEPATFYMHVGGHGDPIKMAEAIHAALGASKTPLTPPAPPAAQPAIDLDTAH